ncbi:hypothetical protein H4R34_000731 [Dimargaris verticillata]|uniref:P-loop containing nucleoside triphosphate hydrolase protein n=1 Tax=Dimargaris verticillata TaxID=2761393 RepID=A0A9W8EBK9_9FUNG|nr:hypothetical protein H4R34_000731 [Dimargaris verticillata]
MSHQQLTAIVDHLAAVHARLPLDQRYLVSLSGRDQAIIVPMDGFHWSRVKLGTFPDPEEALRRRGAPYTFDAQAVRAPITPRTNHIMAPTFDHHHKDPQPNSLVITPQHRMVLFEGLYLQLASVDLWQDIPPLMDEAWWIECPLAVCRKRVIQRHVDSGISPDHDAATVRTDDNDLRNARFILDHHIPTVDRIIEQPIDGSGVS